MKGHQVLKYYPTSYGIVSTSSLSLELKDKLAYEIEGSRYGEWASDFLHSCNQHLILEQPEASLHVISNESQMPSLLVMQRALKRVVCLLRAFKINKKLDFWLIPTQALREHPEGAALVKEKHINGGYTYPHKNQIFILRFEEFPKVMLHETIHHLPLDTGVQWSEQDLMMLYKHFDIDMEGCPLQCTTNLAPNEAIVETWAEYYHLVFLNYEYGFSFHTMLSKEKEWAAQQAKWILRHQKQHYPKWKETTHAWSYMLLRAAILWNLDAFLKKRVPYSTADLTEFLISSAERDQFQKAVKQAKLPSVPCMRMTAFGNM